MSTSQTLILGAPSARHVRYLRVDTLGAGSTLRRTWWGGIRSSSPDSSAVDALGDWLARVYGDPAEQERVNFFLTDKKVSRLVLMLWPEIAADAPFAIHERTRYDHLHLRDSCVPDCSLTDRDLDVGVTVRFDATVDVDSFGDFLVQKRVLPRLGQ